MSKPRLTYFSSRGRGELIRVLLAEAGVDYEELAVGPFHPRERTPGFLEVLATGKLAYDALPLWEEADGFVIVQSDAIVRHIARTRGLYGAGDREATRCDVVLEGVKDARTEIMRVIQVDPSGRAEARADLVSEGIPRWLGYLERILAANRGGEGFFVGDSVTCADLAVWLLLETVTDNDLIASLAALPRLAAFKGRIQGRERVARYVASPTRYPAQLLPK